MTLNLSTLGSAFEDFSSEACKKGEICPEMQIIAKLASIPKYLLSTDENNNYSENNTCMKQGKTPFRYWENFSFIILSVKNMKGLLFGFKGLTWAKCDLFILFLFSLVFVVVSSRSPSSQTFECNTFLAAYEIRHLQTLRLFQCLQSPLHGSVCKLMSFSFPVTTNASFARPNIIINVLPCPERKSC